MENHSIIIYILLAVIVTNLIRVTPMFFIKGQIQNRFVRSFLYYVPYVTLAVMTFPDMILTTTSPLPGPSAVSLPISADAPLLIGDGVGELPCDANIPVGFNPEWEYTLQEAQIYSGTTILLFTDGLTEAMNINYELFQMDRINEVANKALAQQRIEPRELIEQMTEAVHQFVGEAEQSDDLTMMGIQFIKKTEPSA